MNHVTLYEARDPARGTRPHSASHFACRTRVALPVSQVRFQGQLKTRRGESSAGPVVGPQSLPGVLMPRPEAEGLRCSAHLEVTQSVLGLAL